MALLDPIWSGLFLVKKCWYVSNSLLSLLWVVVLFCRFRGGLIVIFCIEIRGVFLILVELRVDIRLKIGGLGLWRGMFESLFFLVENMIVSDIINIVVYIIGDDGYIEASFLLLFLICVRLVPWLWLTVCCALETLPISFYSFVSFELRLGWLEYFAHVACFIAILVDRSLFSNNFFYLRLVKF